MTEPAVPVKGWRAFLKDLGKDAAKKTVWFLLGLIGLYVLSLIGQLFRLGRTPELSEIPALLTSALKNYLDKLSDPFEYAAAHPVMSAVLVLLASITLVLFELFRRGRRRLREQRATLDGLAKYEALAVRSGLKEWWPHAAKDGSGAPWEVLRSDIQRADNNSLCILGANGLETFGAPESPLHDTLVQFRRGNTRVILLKPGSDHADRRAAAVHTRPGQYKRAIEASENFLKGLKQRGYPVSGRFYDGRSNWKLIITNRTCWMQYYLPGGPDVDQTPVYRFDSTADQNGLYHYFCLEFERIWDRCQYDPMSID